MNVFVIAAQTVDGFIAKDENHLSTKWTSPEDAKWFNQRTKQAGVIVMGSKTFATINRVLPGRVTIVYTRHPAKLIKEHTAVEIKLEELLPQIDPKTLYVTKLEPEELIKALEEQNYFELAVCGGTNLYTHFLKSGVVSTLYLTIEPVFFGKGLSLCNEALDLQISLTKITDLSHQTKVLEYTVGKNVI